MIKHLVVSIGLIASCNMVYADVTVMDNSELAAAALPTQQEPQQMPALPEYNADGQIGGLTAETMPPPVAGAALVTPAEVPSASSSGSSGGLALQLPLASAINQLLNFASRNR